MKLTFCSCGPKPRVSWVRCVSKHPVTKDREASRPALACQSPVHSTLAVRRCDVHHVVAPSLSIYPPICRNVIDLPINSNIHRSLFTASIVSCQLRRCEGDQGSSQWIVWGFLNHSDIRAEVRFRSKCPSLSKEMTEEREKQQGDHDCRV